MLLRTTGLELEDAEINELVERSEGWAAGLYLIALAARAGLGEGDARDVLSITGADRYLADYFRSEYLSRLHPERLSFLRRTSVLEELNGPLCDAVLDGKGSALELASLEQANLFVVPLDGHRGLFRYHHLFRDLLLQELAEREPELVPVLNQRAADWFEAQGDPESTLAYSLAAGNEDNAARILSSIAMPVAAAGRVATVESWLERFDDESLHRYPAVAVEGSRIHALGGRAKQAEAWLAAAERGAAREKAGTVKACIEILRAAMCADGPERMLSRSKSALAELAPEHPWHPWALVVNGTAHLLLGDRDQAERAFTGAAATPAQTESHALALSQRSLLAAGRDDALAENLALEAHRLIEDGQLDGYATSALDFAATARALLRHGRWDEARRQLTLTQRLSPSLTHAIPWLAVQVRLELGHAHVTLRDHDGASALLGEAKEILALRPSLGVLAEQIAALEDEIEAMPKATDGGGSGLTPAELRLLPLLATHLSFREIGEQLFVSRNTIKTQAISVYRKLGVSSRSDAIATATELGLVEVAVGAPASGRPADVRSAVS
jgi:LuxR family maltose regulon positive regulatory protein